MTTSTPQPSSSRSVAIFATLMPLALVAAVGYWWWQRPDVSIGVEGRRTVEVVGPLLSPAPFTPGDAVAVRIAEARPVVGGYQYDLRYMAFGPGTHDLAKYMCRPDGTSPAASREFAVTVGVLVPDDYSGELFATPNSPIDLHTGYTWRMRAAWTLWALMLVPLAWYGHKRRRRRKPIAPPPSIAERLRGLLEQAAREPLTDVEQADLEQLLLAFWSERLKLPQERLAATLAELRRHPQAGAQWNRVERWLHSRRGATSNVAVELLNDLRSLN